ncbi:MFS transporter [Nocardioides sp. HDW12B]|uniref:MFS transporter n=1 Tax=Nocardioides sp. HDW12B TaxID=2714939 RepID=UPI001409E21F|nr:MFS transporter [Nocardioides sp. HDW12B]QIK67814.1 MFS transporter [Nocardioides sp. HDW12B]
MTPTRPSGVDLVDLARRAVGVVFVVNGFAFASWVSRIPDLRDTLALSPGQVGLLLLCLSAGTVLALPLSGLVVHRLGPARTVTVGSVLTAGGLVAMAGGLSATSVPLTGAALFAYGAGTSSWDVAMNVEAADVERRLGRSIMPRFHAGFSIGTVAGALVGAGSSHLGVPLPAQMLVTSVLVVLGVAAVIGRFLAVQEQAEDHVRPSAWSAWREPRTLAIGLVVMSFALAEGIANDWLALGLVDGYGAAPALGSFGYALFVVAMTTGRFFGGGLATRFGRVLVLRVTALLVALGALVVILSPSLPLAFVGALVWGIGASLGFPMGMTAAADEEAHAATRVAVVSSIGYCAFLGGPPLIGALGERVGVLDSMLVAVAAAVVGLLATRAVAPPAER